MNARLLLFLCAAALLVAAAPASAAPKKRIYVSLGDSIAWGYARSSDGSVVQSPRDFSARLARRARRDRRYSRRLAVRRLGCPGETTGTYRLGGRCEYAGFASQQAVAAAFIRNNRRRIAFITISLGMGNFTPCARGLSIDVGCVGRATGELSRDLGPIYRSLRRAAGRRIPIATTTLYDPYLAFYLRGADYRELALLTVDLVRGLNHRIRERARSRRARVRVAGVFDAFRTGVLGTTTSLGGEQVPVAVAEVCRLTLMCQPAPVGPDVHPTDFGYARIANAFVRALKLRANRPSGARRPSG